MTTHGLTDEVRSHIAQVFRDAGVEETVLIPTDLDRSEAIFVVVSPATLPEDALTTQLTNELRRKVWITTYGSAWEGRVEPLVAA